MPGLIIKRLGIDEADFRAFATRSNQPWIGRADRATIEQDVDDLMCRDHNWLHRKICSPRQIATHDTTCLGGYKAHRRKRIGHQAPGSGGA